MKKKIQKTDLPACPGCGTTPRFRITRNSITLECACDGITAQAEKSEVPRHVIEEIKDLLRTSYLQGMSQFQRTVREECRAKQ